MQNFWSSAGLLPALLLLLLSANSEGQQANNKVSSRLDFEDAETGGNSTNVPILSGQGRTANDEHSNNNHNSTNMNNNSNDKSRPKIHGVRVIVDTGDGDKAKESKESVELSSDGGGKYRKIGIHTDITFEISGVDVEDSNFTKSRSDDEKEDGDVPIFKGRGSTTHKPHKPHESRHNWNPNFSAERRGYDNQPPRTYPNYYPQYPRNDAPIYTGGSADRRHDNGWVSYSVPGSASYWTTERTSYNEPYRPNTVPGYHRSSSWKPCYCVSQTDNRRRRERSNTPDAGTMRAYSPVIQMVDGKLEQPFSRK